MNNKKNKDVDIFQRTLCCNPIRKNEEEEEEIELYESETIDLEELKKEEGLVEEVDIKLLLHEMNCIKRRIQTMQLLLKLHTDECPEEKCIDNEVLLNCSQHKEICALQKNQNMLQCQIKELIKSNKFAKEQIQDLQLCMCEKNNEIIELKESVKSLMVWKSTLQHEFGKCLERFEYLKHVKAECRDVKEEIEKLENCVATLKKTFVPKECFQQEHKSLMSAINEIKEMFGELDQHQLKRVAALEHRLRNKN